MTPPLTPWPLGRLLNHDERSRAFPAPTATALKNVTHRHYGPTLNQGALGSCTANALIQARNTVPVRRGRPLLVEDDALSVYRLATTLDPFPGAYPPDDTGSSGLAACKAARTLGLIGAYEHAFGLDHVLEALVLNPVMIGVGWREAMFYPAVDGMLAIDGPEVGGHEVLLIGLSTRHRYVTGLNSWGPGWGVGGRFRLSWDDLGALLEADGDATVPRP